MEDIPEKWLKKWQSNTCWFVLFQNIWNRIWQWEKKYDLLSKLIMSCLSIQNGNAGVECSLSDNKNTQTPERTKLGHDTLMGLRRMKEHSQES